MITQTYFRERFCYVTYIYYIVFQLRYKGHIQAIRNNKGNSGYSNHILNTGHAYGSITDTKKGIRTEKKRTSEYAGKIPNI
jgi:hypothetical protein